MGNSRSLVMRVVRPDQQGGDVEISIFNLPAEYIDRAIAAFDAPNRYSYTAEQSVYPAEMKALQAENRSLRDEVRDLKASKLETV